MLRCLTLSILTLIFSAQIAVADTFIVTSNADSGPGTLREAITMANANGTAVIDSIHFNIADVSEVGRTISLLTDLPVLTSKIILDGSTQPGSFIGVSNAKIIITTADNGNNVTALKILYCTNVEIYGLYIKDMHNDMGWKVYGISLFNCKKITIGASGNGNYFTGNVESINSLRNNETFGLGYSDSVVIQSNIFGLTEDGKDFMPGIYYSIRLYNAKNLLLGGENLNEGNFISGPLIQQVSFLLDSSFGKNTIIVKKNKFGISYQEDIPLKFGGLNFQNLETTYTTNLTDIIIKENLFENIAYAGSNSPTPMITITGTQGFVDIKSNRINIMTANYSGFAGGANTSTGIFIGNCKDGIVGGSNPSDTNYIIGAYTSGIALYENEKISITKNSIYCNYKGINASSSKVLIPEVKIMNENGTDMVSGTATPNCRIEVFQTPSCQGCNNGRIFMGETISDANGDWNFTGTYNSAVTATATTNDGVTGEFAKPEFDNSKIKLGFPVCNQNNGFIKGMEFIKGTKYYWIKNSNDTVFNQLDLEDIGPGYYEFVVEQTKYCYVSYKVALQDYSPKINAQFASIIQPSCGLFNGRIYNISLSGKYDKIFWINETRDTIAKNAELTQAGEGKYKLIIWNSEYNCADSTEWFQLINQSGPSLYLDNVQIISATCDNSNGSITNISATNVTDPTFIQWIDSLNNSVGSSLDLINVPAGKYKMKFKDQYACDTIITLWYVVPATGKITIDETAKNITAAGCTKNNGAIEDILVTGANTYEWNYLDNNATAGTAVNAYHLQTGNYQLTVSNTYGCSKSSSVITVPQATFKDIGTDLIELSNAVCGENNGYVRARRFNADPTYYSFRWIDSASSQFIGTGTSIENLGAGTYLLFATDSNGCEKQIFKFICHAFPKPVIDESQVLITPDQCSTKKGAISGIKITGLLGPTTYKWVDENNNIISNSKDLTTVGKGKYQLIINDANTCTIASNWYTVTNNDIAGLSPVYENVIIPRNSAATLKIKNFEPGNYFLYADPAGTQLLEQNITGNFTTQAINTDTYLYVQHINGTCKSPIVPINITVVDKSYFAIASAFTPNNDGINDLLRLQVIGYIEVEYFKIYNRNGEEVFSTKNIGDGWDGKIKGFFQPSGVFIWMAKGKDLNGNIITDKGTFALIR